MQTASEAFTAICRKPIIQRTAVILLLALYWLMAVSASLNWSHTFDEIAHLTGGFSYWHTGDYRIHPENGPLPQLWATIPLLFMHVKFPPLNQPAWWNSDLWALGYQFFYGMGNDLDRMLFAGRAMIALLGVALGLLVYIWSREIFGAGGALLSLLLFVFCPNMLAHGALTTGDMATALFLLLSVFYLWKFFNDPRAIYFLLAALAVAGLCLCKASFVIIVPIVVLLLAARAVFGGQPRRLLLLSGSIAAMAVSVVLLIWSCYSFRYSAFASGVPGRDRLRYTWEERQSGGGRTFLVFARSHKILPESFLFQTAAVFSIGNRRSFMNGNYSMLRGWWYFFPYCFAIKTPLPLFLILMIGAVFLFSKRKHNTLYSVLPLLIFLGLYWGLAIASKLNIGHRHLLPVYPALYILAGSATIAFQSKRFLQVILVAATAWFIGESIVIRPHYLAYFNQIIGGPSHAYRHLVDGSLDWGQDLPGLRNWLAENNADRQLVYLSYFGTASPDYYGISAIRLPSNAEIQRPQDKTATLKNGIYCISATMLQSLFAVPFGPWTASYEKAYQEMLADLNRNPEKQFSRRIDEFQRYRFARLCAYLRKRDYDAQIGYSILIFRLSDAEIQRAIAGPL